MKKRVIMQTTCAELYYRLKIQNINEDNVEEFLLNDDDEFENKGAVKYME